MFSSHFMLFPTFLGNKIFWGGGGVLASESVGGMHLHFMLPAVYNFVLWLHMVQK